MNKEEITKELQKLTLPTKALELWSETINKNLNKFIIPTQTTIDQNHQALQKARLEGIHINGLTILRQTVHPILSGWTIEEIIEALEPFTNTIIRKYGGKPENKSDGAIGIWEALRTDAGISAFAQHAYPHIRTNIRRPIKNKIIQQNEISTITVRKKITCWLTNTWIKQQANEKAQSQKYINYETIPQQIIYNYLKQTNQNPTINPTNKKGYEREKEILQQYQEHLQKTNPTKYQELLTKGQNTQQQILLEATNKTTQKLAKLEKRNIPINKTPLIKDDELIWVHIQKLGNNKAYTKLVPADYKLPENPQLHQYLKRTLHLKEDHFPTIQSIINSLQQSRSQERIINIETDFNQEKYASKTTPDPTIRIEKQELKNTIEWIINKVITQLKLTPQQQIVLCFTYGIPYHTTEQEAKRLEKIVPGIIQQSEQKYYFKPAPVDGNWLAKNIGKISAQCNKCDKKQEEHTDNTCTYQEKPPISRQRINQYLKKIQPKIKEKVIQTWFSRNQKVRTIQKILNTMSPNIKNLLAYMLDINGADQEETINLSTDITKEQVQTLTGIPIESNKIAKEIINNSLIEMIGKTIY